MTSKSASLESNATAAPRPEREICRPSRLGKRQMQPAHHRINIPKAGSLGQQSQKSSRLQWRIAVKLARCKLPQLIQRGLTHTKFMGSYCCQKPAVAPAWAQHRTNQCAGIHHHPVHPLIATHVESNDVLIGEISRSRTEQWRRSCKSRLQTPRLRYSARRASCKSCMSCGDTINAATRPCRVMVTGSRCTCPATGRNGSGLPRR